MHAPTQRRQGKAGKAGQAAHTQERHSGKS
jgi:hypothetical protein